MPAPQAAPAQERVSGSFSSAEKLPDSFSRRAGGMLLLVLAGGIGLNHAVIQPKHCYLLDFRAYYAAGRALHMGVNPYDLDAVGRSVTLPGQQRIVRYFYPPPTLGLMYVLAWLPYPAGQVPWCLLQLALLLLAFGLMCRAVGCRLGSPAAVLIGFAFLSSAAVAELFRWGQIDMLVLALLAAAYLALVSRRTGEKGVRDLCAGRNRVHPTVATEKAPDAFLAGIAGACIGLAAVVKVTPLLYLGVLLLRKEVKALVVAVICMAALMLGAYGILGGEICRFWLLSLSGFSGELPTLVHPHNMSLRAFVYRALVNHESGDGPSVPWIDAGPAVGSAVAWGLIVVIAGVTVWWMYRHRRVLNTAECLAAAIPAVLLSSAVTWTHHGVQLLVPLAVVAATALRVPRLGALDWGWLLLILLLYANWPVERFGLVLPPWLAHAAGPTATYAIGLTWLFMVLRYVPLKKAAEPA
jgi:alpha-1,2-mannosyltransferase